VQDAVQGAARGVDEVRDLRCARKLRHDVRGSLEFLESPNSDVVDAGPQIR